MCIFSFYFFLKKKKAFVSLLSMISAASTSDRYRRESDEFTSPNFSVLYFKLFRNDVLSLAMSLLLKTSFPSTLNLHATTPERNLETQALLGSS